MNPQKKKMPDQNQEQTQDKPQGKRSSSKSSKPKSTPKDLLENLVGALRAVAEEAGVEGLPESALTQTVLESLLGREDVLLKVDVRAYDSNGEMFRVSGVNTAPGILSDAMHLEAARNFEEMFHSMVVRPCLSRFNTKLNELTRRPDARPGMLPSHEGDSENNEDKGYIAS